MPWWLALLAEAYGKAGRPEAGLTALTEALALVDTSEERWYEAELYRLQGELLRRSSVRGLGSPISPPAIRHWTPDADAETCFRQALDVARRQEAKSLELRAAMSLSRLWQQQGRQDAARALLAPIYGWFTEGFDTPTCKRPGRCSMSCRDIARRCNELARTTAKRLPTTRRARGDSQ